MVLVPHHKARINLKKRHTIYSKNKPRKTNVKAAQKVYHMLSETDWQKTEINQYSNRKLRNRIDRTDPKIPS